MDPPSLLSCQIRDFLGHESPCSGQDVDLLCARGPSLPGDPGPGAYLGLHMLGVTGSSYNCPRLPSGSWSASLTSSARGSMGLLFVRGINVGLLASSAFV